MVTNTYLPASSDSSDGSDGSDSSDKIIPSQYIFFFFVKCLTIQIVTELKNLNCDKTKKLKL